jgi:mono/diheme cytochrome c family protein
MFSLDGKIGPIVPTLATGAGGGGPGGRGAGPSAPVVAEATKPLDLAAGEAIYKAACVACHGATGTGGHGGGPPLIGGLTTDHIRLITTTGRNNMPTFREIYTADQVRDVSEFINQVLAKK